MQKQQQQHNYLVLLAHQIQIHHKNASNNAVWSKSNFAIFKTIFIIYSSRGIRIFKNHSNPITRSKDTFILVLFQYQTTSTQQKQIKISAGENEFMKVM